MRRPIFGCVGVCVYLSFQRAGFPFLDKLLKQGTFKLVCFVQRVPFSFTHEGLSPSKGLYPRKFIQTRKNGALGATQDVQCIQLTATALRCMTARKPKRAQGSQAQTEERGFCATCGKSHGQTPKRRASRLSRGEASARFGDARKPRL